MRLSRLRLPAYVVAVVLAYASFSFVVSAQDTGGSFGGSDFGGGGGGGSDFGGGGGGSDFGGGGGSDFGSSNYGGSDYSSSSYSGGGGGSGDPGACCCTIVIIGFLCLFILASTAFGKGRRVSGMAGSMMTPMRSGPVGDVSAIRIALDHNARPPLQARLDALAKSGAAGTAAGRASALHEVCIELRRNQTSWLYASVENSPVRSVGEIQSRYQQIAQDARSRFRVETVRSGDGVLSTQDDTKTRDRGEGPGIVVVTVLVAARRELVDVHQPEDARALNQILMGFGAIQAGELMGLEVVWSPSTENDRMTEPEMLRVYPEMRRIRDDTIAGRLFCGYCGSPFGHELSRCPHCGAAATDARPRTPQG